jgi:hypothetical protein
LKPLLSAAVVTTIAASAGGPGRRAAVPLGLTTFVLVAGLLNSRLGRDLEEATLDRALDTWHRLRVDLLPGLFRLIMELFEKALELLDRLIYTIDEKLRFTSGQGRASFAIKAVLGVIWFYIAYVMRIYINLLVEPTINPIKHFPVVTVAAKIMLPVDRDLFSGLWVRITPWLGRDLASVVAAANVGFLPGFFGFLVWEFKENWRLYAANRSPVLQPVLVGHHGETIARFLRPGIHSGTLPKLYGKLRRAERRSRRGRPGRSTRKYREALHHAEREIRNFVERELLAILRSSREFAAAPLASGTILLGWNRIRVALGRADRPQAPAVVLDFEEQSGWLVAGVAEAGWLAGLSEAEVRAFAAALTGSYKRAAVGLVREQIAAALGAASMTYDINERGLTVWPRVDDPAEATYDLWGGHWLVPEAEGTSPALPVLVADQVVFARRPLVWTRWVEIWEADQAGGPPPYPLLESVPVLPESDRTHVGGSNG